MAENRFLSVLEIKREISSGQETTKFLLKRFAKWFPHRIEKGQTLYSPQAVNKLLLIKEKIDSGILPSQIEKDLEREALVPADESNSSIEDIRLSKKSIKFMKSLFKEIGSQQERIANAHEKRAIAEERKAVAIEKRAQAEENKAQAMNNIAAALQEMNKVRSNDIDNHQIVHQAASVLINDELDPSEDELQQDDVLEDLIEDQNIDDLSVLLDDIPEVHLDNLSKLVDDNDFNDDFDELSELVDDPEAVLDDLSILIDDPLGSGNDLESFIENENPDKIDDLSLLIDNKINDADIEIDDLSKLIDEPSENDIDDLSELIDKESDVVIDDLSMLIKDKISNADLKIDDLSLLIDEQAETVIDDLSKLIEEIPIQENLATEKIDDLSQLIENNKPEDEIPIVKPIITPEQDLEKYKSAVINIIMELKSEGLTVQETTARFNEEGIKTLSGKDLWSEKAIAQVYKFIDSAKK